MLAATHAIAGAIIATKFTSNPNLGYLLAFLSHPLLDLFPHWDFNSRWAKRSKLHTFILSAADSGTGILIGLVLFANSQNLLPLMLTMLIAQWPDFLEAPYHFGFAHLRFFKWIKYIQHLWHTKLSWPWGFIPQLGILFFAIWFSFSQ